MYLYTINSKNIALGKLGITNLREWQIDPLESILQGKDVFIRKTTGGGKSLLFQLPAIMEKGKVLSIVISPLRALQQDQVTALRNKGINAVLLNSDLSKSERKKILQDLSSVNLLYLAPEQLGSKDLRESLKNCGVARIVVDEAHILPQAELSFREAYGKIGEFISFLEESPQIIACTATATPKDVNHIAKKLGMQNPRLFLLPVRRENLHLQIKRIEAKGKRGAKEVRKRNMRHAVERILEDWNGKGSVIIYCPTVKGVETTHKWLKARGWKVGKYTGKMKQSKRSKNQTAFMGGNKPIMVATNAFGLGIDKPDIRLVIHAGLPLSMDGYVQEIGRAGRDGKVSRCVLLYSKSDFDTNNHRERSCALFTTFGLPKQAFKFRQMSLERD